MTHRFIAGIVLLCLSIVVSGCSKKQQVIILDDWWNVDYAKNACSMGNSDKKCSVDPTAEVRDFETRLGTEFAINGACHDITLDDSIGHNGDWVLMLDFLPGQEFQTWRMTHLQNQLQNGVTTSGKADPKQIAKAICSVVSGTGGSLK